MVTKAIPISVQLSQESFSGLSKISLSCFQTAVICLTSFPKQVMKPGEWPFRARIGSFANLGPPGCAFGRVAGELVKNG